jgi:hypothetical protein
MNSEFVQPAEIEKQRAKPGIAMDEFIQLNDEARRRFPRTKEESRQKTESLMAMPEFVL